MPGQTLLFCSAEIPAEYPIVPRALPFSLSPASLRYKEAFAEDREILLTNYPMVVVKLYGVWINEKQMFRTSQSKSGIYLPVIIYFVLKKRGKLGSW